MLGGKSLAFCQIFSACCCWFKCWIGHFVEVECVDKCKRYLLGMPDLHYRSQVELDSTIKGKSGNRQSYPTPVIQNQKGCSLCLSVINIPHKRVLGRPLQTKTVFTSYMNTGFDMGMARIAFQPPKHANLENSSKHWFRNMQIGILTTTLAKKLCWDGIHGNHGAMMIQNIKNNCQCRLPQNMSREIWEWWILKTFIYAPSPKITKYSKGF